MPSELVNRLNHRLSYSASRSKWIRDAIELRLDENETKSSDDFSYAQCLMMCHARTTDQVAKSMIESLISLQRLETLP